MATEVMIRVDEQGRASGVTASDAETLASLAGATYRAVLTQPRGRSLSQLNLWWAVCQLIADNHPGDLSKRNVSDTLLINCGHAKVWETGGIYYRAADSIAFTAMSSEDFSKLLDLALMKAGPLFGDDLALGVVRELESMGAPDLREAA